MKKCLGCGTPLQYKDPSSLGYTEKKENNLCERCFKLKNYGTYKNVPLTNDDYRKILDNIPDNSLVLYVTDILSLDLLGIENFNNTILVITKKDILPKSTKSEKIINYMKERYPNLLDIFFISSKTEEGINSLYQKLVKLSNFKDIYLVGTTNSGKSTLINKLISIYGETITKNPITVSMYPSTTLDKIEIKLNNLTLIDTPGLINERNIVNYLTPSELKQITPKKTIKPKSCQIEGKGSILIGTFARIDYNTKERNSIVIYTSNNINIRFASLKNNIYHDYPKHNFNLAKEKDIVIPGLGFIKCTKDIQLSIYTIKGVVPNSRDNLI